MATFSENCLIIRKGLTLVGFVIPAMFVLSQCGSTGGGGTVDYDPGYGPFDKNGNYIESEADKPAKRKRPARLNRSPELAKKSEPKKKEQKKKRSTASSSQPVVVASSSSLESSNTYKKPKPATVYKKPKPKPATTYKKPTPKPKPKPVRTAPKLRFYTVKKGDTLYGISRRYGTSVSKIQQTNGVRGTNIRIGQVLKIPR